LLPDAPSLDLADFGSRLAKATGGLRVRAVSWHDASGRVLWSSQPLLGIEQREAIRDALESFSGVGARLRVDRNLGDNQTAVLLRAATATAAPSDSRCCCSIRACCRRTWRGPVPRCRSSTSSAGSRPRRRAGSKVPAKRSRDADVALKAPEPQVRPATVGEPRE
jgi:hypothetical protein